MVTTIVARSASARNTFVAPAVPLPGYEQGNVLYRLGYSIGVCVTDAQAHGWLDAEQAANTRREARNG